MFMYMYISCRCEGRMQLGEANFRQVTTHQCNRCRRQIIQRWVERSVQDICTAGECGRDRCARGCMQESISKLLFNGNRKINTATVWKRPTHFLIYIYIYIYMNNIHAPLQGGAGQGLPATARERTT